MRITKITEASNPSPRAGRLIALGILVIGVVFVGIGGWAATAPLASASVGTGTVGVSSHRQTIQHLEGGIVASIPVRDGDLVNTGDLLVKLDDTRALANFEIVRGQYLSAIGERSRLEAERDGKADISWPRELQNAGNDPEIEIILRGQRNVFQSRREFLVGQEAIISERKLQLDKEIEALESQLRATIKKTSLIGEELATVQQLVNRGLERMPRLLSLKRAAAEIEGSEGEISARIARGRQSISELSAQFSDTKNKIMNEVTAQLREVETKIADLSQRMRGTKDILDRIEIRAPRAGYVVNLAFHTIGGVIEPGRPILDLVPLKDNLIIETRFDPKNSDVLRVGLAAEVTLTPYNRRSVPPVAGRIVTLSADSLIDQKTGVSYFAGRIEVDSSQLEHLPDVKLVPGMPVEVMVRTGERTALEYIIDPFQRSIHRAFREK